MVMDISTDQQSTKYIMQKINDLKIENTALRDEKENLEILCKKQKERSLDMEKNRNILMKLLNEKVDDVRACRTEIRSLRIENSNLNSTIQDQNLLINEQSKTIEQLKKENALLKKKRNEPNNVIDRGIKQTVPVIKHVIAINGTNGNHFSHPSFDPPSLDVHKKKKKKSPLALRNRYSNLDISGNGIRRKEGSPEENNKSSSPTGKKRRLYSLEDDMIDLTIDANEE